MLRLKRTEGVVQSSRKEYWSGQIPDKINEPLVRNVVLCMGLHPIVHIGLSASIMR